MSWSEVDGSYSIVGPDETDETLVGPGDAPSEASARAILQRMSEARTPTASELEILDLYFAARPVVAVGSRTRGTDRDADLLLLYNRRAEAVAKAARSVGVINTVRNGVVEEFATGFLVGDVTLVTNAHVVRKLVTASDAPPLVQFPRQGSSAGPLATFDRLQSIRARTDIAFVTLVDWSDQPPGALPLGQQPSRQREPVVVVGYPLPDPSLPPAVADSLFDDRYGKQSAAPGRVTRIYATSSFSHDCTTAGGNSGSPILRLTDGTVAGVHRGGTLFDSNLATTSQRVAAMSAPRGARRGTAWRLVRGSIP